MPCHKCYNIAKLIRQRYAFLPAMLFPPCYVFPHSYAIPPRYAFSLPAMLFPSCYTCCRCYCQFITTFLCYQRLKCGYFVMSYTEILQYIQNLYYKLTETLLKATVITKCLFG